MFDFTCSLYESYVTDHFYGQVAHGSFHGNDKTTLFYPFAFLEHTSCLVLTKDDLIGDNYVILK